MAEPLVNGDEPWNVVRSRPFTSQEDAEAVTLIGWLWGAPRSVRTVVGKRVWADMNTRTVRLRKP
jgi:hypothetical protein